MKFRKLLAICMAFAMVSTGITGCASSNDTGSGAASAAPSAAATSKQVELELFESKAEVVDVMDKIIAKFTQENPTIKVTQTSTSDGRTVLQTRLSTNEMPDILNTYPAEEFYKSMFRENIMVDLTGKDFLSKTDANILKMSELDGKNYALPMTVSAYGIYIRTDIFEKYEVKEPTTYKELIEACEKLKAAGVTPFTFPNKELGNIAQRFERTTGIINNDSNTEFQKIAKGELNIKNAPTMKAQADMIVQLLKYGPSDSLGIDYDSAMADFCNGKAAIIFCGTWGLSTMKKNNPDIKVKLISFPNPIGETKVPINIDTSFSVTSACKHPQEALKFLEFLTRPEIAQMYCDVDGNPNLIQGVQYKVPEHQIMKDSVDKGNTFLTAVNFWPSNFREEMQNPLQKLIMNGDKDAFLSSANDVIAKMYKSKS